ncbi:MAG: NAD(P)/FAD-dependent oxidoreductase [Anaerolineae bacterium]
MITADLPPTADAAIIGGGINGAAAAFFLARAGLRPVIIERLPVLAGLTTSKSMEAFRAQFVEPEHISLMLESIDFYVHFAERTGLADCDIGLHQQGYLFLTGRPEQIAEFQERVTAQHAHGLSDVAFLDGDTVRKEFPYVSAVVVAGTFRQGDGWLSSNEAAQGFARASGAQIVLNTTAIGFLLSGGRVTSVQTDRGIIATPVVVLAAGPYAARVAALAGVELPLQVIRRHRVTIGEHPLIPTWAPMTIDQDTAAHWRPEGPGAALAWAQAHEQPSEPVDNVRPNPNFPFEVLEGVSRLSPFWEKVASALKSNQVRLSAGQYTMTPEGEPIVGPHPELDGLYLMVSCNGHGVMAAPGVGRLLADLVMGRRDDASNPFSYRRLLTSPEHVAVRQRLL